MSILAHVLRAYVKLRQIVRTARHEKWKAHELVERLMVAMGKNEIDFLDLVAQSFYKRDRTTLTRKRQTIGWGNIKKIYDKLHRMLDEEVQSWKMKCKLSKNYWNQLFLRRLLLECFRARAIAHTIARYRKRLIQLVILNS